MNSLRHFTQSTLIGVATLSLSMIAVQAQSNLPPGAEDMPSGYTLSKTAIPGKHCYQHGGGHVYFYCYSRTISASEIKSHSAMMMHKNDSMMMKKDSTMMKKDDSMMKGK